MRKAIAVTLAAVEAAATMVVGAVLGLLPRAHANSQDDHFLNLLSARGIQGDSGQLIASAHAACDSAGNGRPNLGMTGVFGGIVGQGFSPQQPNTVIVAAVGTYCPEKMPAGLSPLAG
jgi:hypothetical protein